MTAIMNHSELVNAVKSVNAPAIESKPLVGPEITIRIALTPGTLFLIATPLAVGITMVLGYVFLTTFGLPLMVPEMIGAAILTIVAGVLASLPAIFWMKRGVMAIMQSAVFGMMIRCGALLFGLILAFSPNWGLEKMSLAYWTLGFYFPVLAAETACAAWLSSKATK